MKTVRNLSRKEFEQKFGTSAQCMQHLSELKWGAGYSCRRCAHNSYYKGKKGLNRRCKRCGLEESPTSQTLFHKLKFDLHKAFGMIYDIMLSKKGANSIWLAERYEVSQNTSWLFRRKVQQYLKSSKNNPLTGKVHVDEFEIGTPQKGEKGRSPTLKKVRIVIATEIRNGSVGNAYAQVIQDFSAKSLKSIFDDHICLEAQVKTDGWRGYSPLKQLYKKLTQEESNMGQNFPELHIQIRNFKNWIRGMHSYCDIKNVQDYIDEYFYRFNRRNHRKTIIDNLFPKFITDKSLTLEQLIGITT
jgi:hypothetical protein